MANKIKFGLRNVYYAMITISEVDGSYTYATPKRLPGAVSLSLEQQGELYRFYADDSTYWQTAVNNGYEGDLEVAMITDEFRKDVLAETEDTNGMLVEHQDAITKPFALLFEFQGDENATRHVLYNCAATRPAINGSTKEESIEPQTETLNLSAVGNDSGYVRGKAPYGSANYSTFFEAVKLPA